MSENNAYYPDVICQDCGSRLGNRKPSEAATWHEGDCGVCGCFSIVTQPRDFGHLIPAWQQAALVHAATRLVKVVSRGDQEFVDCLSGSTPEHQKIRLAVSSLAEILRNNF